MKKDTKNGVSKPKPKFKLQKIDFPPVIKSYVSDGYNTWNDGWPHVISRGVKEGAKLDEDALQKYQGVFDEHWNLTGLGIGDWM